MRGEWRIGDGFAADIGRYLSDEPVQAAAPSSTYKFKKFARRNKAAFSVAAAMVVLLLVGGAVADRFERRNTLLLTHLGAAAAALLLLFGEVSRAEVGSWSNPNL